MIKLLNNRLLNALSLLAVISLMLTGIFYFQGYLGLDPCNLCIFQRVAFIGIGLSTLPHIIFNPGHMGTRLLSLVGLTCSAIGASVSGYHVYIQNLPEDQIPDCGPDLNTLMEFYGPLEAIREVFVGAGSCADVLWSFMGLTIPGWTLVWMLGFTAFFLAQLIFGRFDLRLKRA